MAINTWINVTLDAAASKKPDRQDHKNTVVGGTADGNNFTVAFDSAVITNVTLMKSCFDSALQRALGMMPQ
jgi:hypothetical protein